jgi:hypothetical protein
MSGGGGSGRILVGVSRGIPANENVFDVVAV